MMSLMLTTIIVWVCVWLEVSKTAFERRGSFTHEAEVGMEDQLSTVSLAIRHTSTLKPHRQKKIPMTTTPLFSRPVLPWSRAACDVLSVGEWDTSNGRLWNVTASSRRGPVSATERCTKQSRQ